MSERIFGETNPFSDPEAGAGEKLDLGTESQVFAPFVPEAPMNNSGRRKSEGTMLDEEEITRTAKRNIGGGGDYKVRKEKKGRKTVVTIKQKPPRLSGNS